MLGCVVQLGANNADCEATAAKINGHPDYAGAPTIGCDLVSGFYLTPHICGMALLAGVALLVAFLILINVLLLCPSDRVAARVYVERPLRDCTKGVRSVATCCAFGCTILSVC